MITKLSGDELTSGIQGLVIHKRRGHGNPGDQYVTMTLRDLLALTTGERP